MWITWLRISDKEEISMYEIRGRNTESRANSVTCIDMHRGGRLFRQGKNRALMAGWQASLAVF